MAFPQAGLDFIRDLASNNEKEWFQANKKRYEAEYKKPGRALIDEVNAELQTISPAHVTPSGKAINRINRDIRFSKDKTPYNTRLWAGFHNQTVPKGQGAGYYFGFDLDSLGVGCGAWMFPKDRLEAMRTYFAETHDEYLEIVGHADFAAYREVDGDAYKRVPKPWPADHPAGDLLKLKGIHTRRALDPDLITSDDLVSTLASEIRRMQPFVDYIERGLL